MTKSFLAMDGVLILLVAIVALGTALSLLLRRRKKHPAQHIPADPMKKNNSPHSHPRAQLVGLSDIGMSGSNPHQLYILNDQHKITIGRAPGNTIVIPESTVSSFHATIEFIGGRFRLEDNHSSNGTFINNNCLPPHKPFPLSHGSIIKFAKFGFRFLRTDRTPSDATIMVAEILKVND